MEKTAEIFKVLAEPNRVRILAVLAARRACVCELSQALALNQPNVSRHLRILKDAGLVESRRRGVWTDYALNRNAENAPFIRLVKKLATSDDLLKEDAEALANADRRQIQQSRKRPSKSR
jgi:ArsR family transcriptional regulator